MPRVEEFPEDSSENVLTGIHSPYTMADNPEPESDEMNNLIVKEFINTLAEVSISIASRKVEELEK